MSLIFISKSIHTHSNYSHKPYAGVSSENTILMAIGFSFKKQIINKNWPENISS